MFYVLEFLKGYKKRKEKDASEKYKSTVSLSSWSPWHMGNRYEPFAAKQ